MKVLYVASEAVPFAASGGLADVAGSLPKAMRKRLVGCRVVMPLYECVPQELRDNMTFLTSLSVPVAWRRQYCGVFEAKVDGVIYYLLDNQYYFKRQGIYGHYDDAERFAFSRAQCWRCCRISALSPTLSTQTIGRARWCRCITAFITQHARVTRASRRYSPSTTFSIRASMGWNLSKTSSGCRWISGLLLNTTAVSTI